MTAPSNSGPRPVLIVVGENAFHTIDSQIFVAMKREMPLTPVNKWTLANSRGHDLPSQTVAFLQKLVQKDNDKTTETQLDYQ